MADFILIGKTAHAYSAEPHVVYCGQNRAEAVKAAAATGGKYPYLYYVDPQPFQRVAAPAKAVAHPASPSPTPAQAPPPAGDASHKGHSKSKKSKDE